MVPSALQLLTPAGHARARAFILGHARALDRVSFRHHFEGGPAADVWDALAAYRNDDGGFGRALEPDFRLPGSSPMATSVALQVLRETGATADHPFVCGAVAYLIGSYDESLPGWRGVPRAVDDYPHAPWWTQGGEPAPLTPATWSNPNAEIVGYLLEHAVLVPPALLRALSNLASERLDAAPTPLGGYDMLCWLRCAETAPDPLRGRILARARADAPTVFDPDPERWGVDLQPFWLVPSRDAPLADVLGDAAATSLDREIARQAPDGSWPPRWSWSAYPDAWAQAKREWAGEQTLRTLQALAAHGRIQHD